MTPEDLEVLRRAVEHLDGAADKVVGSGKCITIRFAMGCEHSRDALRAIIARETEGRADG